MLDFSYFKSHFVESKDQKKQRTQNFFIAGCDEVGRGPLAGPVVAACASIEVRNNKAINDNEKEIKLLLKSWQKLGVTDSKKLSAKKRLEILDQLSLNELKANEIYTIFCSKNCTAKIVIKEISVSVIDQINISRASLEAMKRAMMESCNLNIVGTVLIDGNRKFEWENSKIKLETIIKGDSKSLMIGLASIAAKEYRDQLMKKFAENYPGYGWAENAGYPTPKHLAAIDQLGVTELHRLTFRGVKEIYAERGYTRI